MRTGFLLVVLWIGLGVLAHAEPRPQATVAQPTAVQPAAGSPAVEATGPGAYATFLRGVIGQRRQGEVTDRKPDDEVWTAEPRESAATCKDCRPAAAPRRPLSPSPQPPPH